jgi:hypothetical protein
MGWAGMGWAGLQNLGLELYDDGSKLNRGIQSNPNIGVLSIL